MIDENGELTNVTVLFVGEYPIEVQAYDMYGSYCTAIFTLTVQDTISPIIVVQPNDIEYTEGDLGHIITWQAFDLCPESYTILKNGSTLKSGLWNTSTEVISISVDGLETGVYNYTLIVQDCVGNNVSDEVLIVVITMITTTTTITTSTSITTTTITTTTSPFDATFGFVTMIITIGSLVVIIIFSIQIMRSKR